MLIKNSIINYLGEINGAVGVLVGVCIDNEKTYQALYWIHPSGHKGVELDENLLDLFHIEKSEDLSFYDDLLKDIEYIIPSKEELFKKFLSKGTHGNH